jgi:hypothetical protein
MKRALHTSLPHYRFRPLFHDHVCVCAAEAERAYARNAFARRVPWSQRCRNRDRNREGGDGRVQTIEMKAGGNLAMAERQNHFYQTGNAGGRLEVPQVGFHRPDGEGVAG